MLVCDIETNGLLPELDRIWCVVVRTPDSVRHWGPDRIPEALEFLEKQPLIVGHNFQGFDIPAIQKVYPSWEPRGKILDTLVCSRLLWPDLRGPDFTLASKNPDFPKSLIGRHSLEAWGYRLGVKKNVAFKQTHDFSEYNQEMLDYCIQDTAVTLALANRIGSARPSPASLELEHAFAAVLDRQMAYGVAFDRENALGLVARMVSRRAELDQELAQTFPPFVDKYTTPKTQQERTRTTLFNPSSREHIARALAEKYGWKPVEYTETGKPKVDDEVVAALPYPEAKLLSERLLLQKRLGQLAEGTQALLSAVKDDGRIHGYINHNGTVTGRCAHSNPNLGQVPSVRHPFGKEFRDLFRVPRGRKLVGADAKGLELRCLAHFMGKYDGGSYAKILLEGDIHAANQEAAGLATRDQAKTFIYAFLYGAGDAKIGSVVGGSEADGKKLRARFLRKLPALACLKEDVQAVAKERGVLFGLDGRALVVRSPHAALNTLLQAAGAVVMKKATVLADAGIRAAGLRAHQVLHVHDEYQFEVDEADAEDASGILVQAIRDAGEYFNFRCPLDGDSKIGNTWADTH